MKKILFSAFISILFGALMLLQFSGINVLAFDETNPITSAIIDTINTVTNPEPSASPQPTPDTSHQTNFTATTLVAQDPSNSLTPNGSGSLTATLTEIIPQGDSATIEKGYISGSFTNLLPDTLYTVWFIQQNFLGYDPIRSDSMLTDASGNMSFAGVDFSIYRRNDQPIFAVNLAKRSNDFISNAPCSKESPCISGLLTLPTTTVAPTPTPSPSSTPTPTPTPQPSSDPITGPISEPTPTPSATPQPTSAPLTGPITEPSPTPTPSSEPITGPITEPTPSPTVTPTPTSTPQPSSTPQAVTVSPASPEVVLTTNSDTVITVPATVTNSSINLTNYLITSQTAASTIYGGSIIVNANTSLGLVNMQIPAGTMISGPANWSGIINLPQVQDNSSVTPPADPNSTATPTAVIEIGFGDVFLTLDKAVRILIPNQANKLVGYSRLGTFTTITQVCSLDSQSFGDSLVGGGDCYINLGNDLVIWTKHFTKFVTYTQNAKNSSGSSGGSGSSSSGNSAPQAPICGDSKPTSAPKLISAISNQPNQVTLVWSKANDPVSYYLISYGLEPGKPLYGNPNVGGKDTNVYVVKGLSGQTTYYFKVRAGNGCMSGENSNEVAVKVVGSKTNTTLAPGFEAGVLSTQTPDSQNQAEDKIEPKFKPITSAEPLRPISGAGNFFSKIFSFILRLFGR